RLPADRRPRVFGRRVSRSAPRRPALRLRADEPHRPVRRGLDAVGTVDRQVRGARRTVFGHGYRKPNLTPQTAHQVTLARSMLMSGGMSQRAASRETAAPLLPERPTLPKLRRAASGCRACVLWKRGAQTVFGEGSNGAQILFVGEQPGDREDIAGRPFVGPAGRLLDKCMEEAGIARSDAYVTNVVKHFKW